MNFLAAAGARRLCAVRAGKSLRCSNPCCLGNSPGRLPQLRGLWGALGCRLRHGMAVWSWADGGPRSLSWLWLSERLTKPP